MRGRAEQGSTLSSLLRAAARSAGEREAIVSTGRRTSYAELEHKVDALATGLLEAGLCRGERVAILLSNREEFLLSYLACSRLGIVSVPINTRLAQPEIETILERSGASALFLEEEFDGRDRRPGLETLRVRLRGPRLLASIEGETAPARFADLLARHDPASVEAAEAEVDPDETALIIFTSGTLGRPKGVMVTHTGLCSYAAAAAAVPLFEPDDRVLIQVPLAVAAGSMIQVAPALAVGATLILLDVFKASESLELIESERVTCFVGPPAILNLQLRAQNFDSIDLSSLRHVITGAAPVPEELAAEVIDRMDVRLTNSYGATETGGLVTYLPANASRMDATKTSGVPIPGYELRIVDDSHRSLGPDEVGELAVRGPSIFVGYLDDDAETRQALKGGWWHTGDLAKLDQRGYLRLVGRKKEMYIRGGYNVYPAEVEAVLQRHPDVLVAAVSGFSDPVLGEKGRAFIVCRTGHKLTADAVKSHCARSVADYKVPDDVVFLDEIPLLGPGKIDRRALRDLVLTGER